MNPFLASGQWPTVPVLATDHCGKSWPVACRARQTGELQLGLDPGADGVKLCTSVQSVLHSCRVYSCTMYSCIVYSVQLCTSVKSVLYSCRVYGCTVHLCTVYIKYNTVPQVCLVALVTGRACISVNKWLTNKKTRAINQASELHKQKVLGNCSKCP